MASCSPKSYFYSFEQVIFCANYERGCGGRDAEERFSDGGDVFCVIYSKRSIDQMKVRTSCRVHVSILCLPARMHAKFTANLFHSNLEFAIIKHQRSIEHFRCSSRFNLHLNSEKTQYPIYINHSITDLVRIQFAHSIGGKKRITVLSSDSPLIENWFRVPIIKLQEELKKP